MWNPVESLLLLVSHPALRWDLWPTYGTFGVLMAAVDNFNFRHVDDRTALALVYQGAGKEEESDPVWAEFW